MSNGYLEELLSYRPVPACVRRAFETVDRGTFIERYFRRTGTGFEAVVLSDASDEARAEVHRNVSLVTEVDGEGRPTSSSTMPGLMLAMILEAQIEEGQSILEIGTATGYNAAVLRSAVGPRGSVTTVEVDESVADAADRHLREAGVADVRVLVRDGWEGAPQDGPFDRIIATVGCGTIPHGWREQLKPDGLVVVPVAHGRLHPIARVRAGARSVWEGRYRMGASFMPATGRLNGDEPPLHRLAIKELPAESGHRRLEIPRPQMESFLFFLSLERPQWSRVQIPSSHRPRLGVGGATPPDGAVVIEGQDVWWFGAEGKEAADAVGAVFDRWAKFDRPSPDRFSTMWYRPGSGDGAAPASARPGSWTRSRAEGVERVVLEEER